MTQALLEQENIQAPMQEDDIFRYLQEIRRYPLLTPEQERSLAMSCAQGDEEAIRTMVNSNLRLVVSIAREYAGRGVSMLDLIQEGSLSLLAAAKNFDYTLEYRFSTYATKCIRQGLARAVLNQAGMIRVPRHTMERMRKILWAKSSLQQETGKEPEIEDISRLTDIPADKVAQLLLLLPQTISLDAPAGDDDSDPLQMLLEDETAPQPYADLVRRELKETMNMLLEQLKPREQQVLRLRFGMEDGICYSYEQIGNALGISKERARQLKRQATDKLHKLGTRLGLEDFLND